ncbi:putative polyketide synthase [Pyrenochaeta sp. MPI-SDFR-AT-0127]|nr:putative polyketide synthase [Pyrenochaeta sp. MPI-SDFR-AT-0127]
MSKLEVNYFGNEGPKEDLQDLFRELHLHSKDDRHSLLACFIAKSTKVIKEEVSHLPSEIKQHIPPFETILSWAEDNNLRDGLLCGAVGGVLLTIAQIGTYIGYVEKHPKSLRGYSNACNAGLGIGLLASTAVALSPMSTDLPLAGADAVRLAFRMGVHVQRVSENLEGRDLSRSPDTWAYVVHNVDPAIAQKELDLIHNAEEEPDTAKIFVSAISPTSITISGPPTRLKAIFNKSRYFRDSRSIALPVFGGICHAPHVYNENDVNSILGDSQTSLYTVSMETHPVMSVYSSSTGQPYLAKDALELYVCVLSELLTQAICWDHVINGLVEAAKCASSSEAILHTFGNSLSLNDLSTGLKNNIPHIDVSVNNLSTWITQTLSDGAIPRGTAQAKLAIVGMSCRLPGGATNTEKFWEILEKGLDVSRRIPADRFDIDTHYDPTGKQLNKTMTQYGCFIDEPGLFDAPFFNMSPREAQVVDPQMRLSLVTAFEALERAGYVGNRTASTQLERIGTFYGQAADDYREVNQGQEVGTYYIPGGCRAFGPGRINYFFKFSGPSYSIDTACSSGLAAIEVACQALWNGDVDMAVAGGVNILTNPDGFAGLCNGYFLTKGHNACKTWDATADGYCRADGVGSLVIKRLEDAEADNDNILGVVLAAGTNHSAEAVSITHPHAGHQAYLARQVLRQAGVDPLDVSYIELHGTGTQAGDYEEMQGVLDVYAPLVKRRSKDQPLHIGSVKANFGHGESVAGTTALIKVLTMLQKHAIPPHIGIKTEINPRFPQDFDKRNLHITFEKKSWPQFAGKKRIAAVNNFGAAGGNTMMVLEEAPTRIVNAVDPRSTFVVAISAKTKGSLAGNIENLISYLDKYETISLADLSYTTTARRYHFSHRVAIAFTDISNLKKQLNSRLGKIESIKPIGKSGPPPIAFAFTGQGASYKSMSLELYHHSPTFRREIDLLDSLAQAQGFPSFVSAIDGSHAQDHAHAPVVTQLALVSVEIALARYWMSLGVKPDLVVGHSLGEYAALHVAGVVTASDVIFMVGRRAQMLSEKCKIGSHTMVAIRASLLQIQKVAGGLPYTVACLNGPSDTVLSGTREQMDNVVASIEAAGFRCIKLDVAFAFHSEQMDPVLEAFEAACKSGVIFQEPKLPVISPLLGKVVFDGKTLNANYMRRASREPVDFVSALESAQRISTVSDETVWVEIGPHPVCTGFIKSIISNSQLVALPSIRRGVDNWTTMSESMAILHQIGVTLNWNDFHGPFEAHLRLLDLPTYAWSEKNYWMQYNGDWCLTKGNTFYDKKKESTTGLEFSISSMQSEIQTSTVQQIIKASIDGAAGVVVMQSDLMQKDFLAAAHGHRMNNCGVVTSSIHADIAYTLGYYLYRKFFPNAKDIKLNIANLVVTKGLVTNSDTSKPQVIRVSASTVDISTGIIDMTWENVHSSDAGACEQFATANVFVENASDWLSTWNTMAHLVHGRIDALESLATDGKANSFSRRMAYTLFASNLVDYSDKYRGMQSVIVHDLEACANVQLTDKESGTWTVPPYFIDSVAHLAGFVMNCSDAIDTQNNYCVTPGWKSMRFAEPLVAGAKYKSYVKMIPTREDPSIYLGDVYILQRETSQIIGMVGGIQFRRYPRILLSRFFSPPDKYSPNDSKTRKVTESVVSAAPTNKASHKNTQNIPHATPSPHKQPAPALNTAVPLQVAVEVPAVDVVTSLDSITAKALQLIAKEAALELEDLVDDADFTNLGVDSLMSLVISEKLRTELDVTVSSSLFLDYPTIGELRRWLDEYYS